MVFKTSGSLTIKYLFTKTFNVSACPPPPDPPQNASSDADSSPSALFLVGDVVNYACDSHLFAISDGVTSTTCQDDGSWSVETISDCEQIRKLCVANFYQKQT